MYKSINITECWCRSKKLAFFSEDYLICQSCNTLIKNPRPLNEAFLVIDDDSDFYGKNYWTKYISNEYGYPNIFELSRKEIVEKCLYWLNILFKYKLPPAKTLELGCGHGGLVYLMKLAGFESSGTEMSPWVCNYASKTFDIPMQCGRIEDLSIAQGSLDVIILMDVLEHMTDPVDSLNVIAKALKDDGIIVIQTPCFRNTQKKFEAMKKENDIFLEQLKEKEHLYLFNNKSIEQILKKVGFKYISFERQLFEYDMFLFASKTKPVKSSEEAIEELLLRTTNGRTTLALKDLFTQKSELLHKLMESETDRAARLEAINELEKRLEESEADRSTRLKVINKLEKRLKESEADRAARLKAINELEKKLEESETDRSARFKVIAELEKMLEESEARLQDVFDNDEIIRKLNGELDTISKHWLYRFIKR